MIADDETVKGVTRRVYLQDFGTRCTASSGTLHLVGYTIPTTGDIILCPRALPPNRNSIIGNDRFKDYEGTTMDLHKMGRVTSKTLFHEMFHALWGDESKFKILTCLFLFHIIDQINF